VLVRVADPKGVQPSRPPSAEGVGCNRRSAWRGRRLGDNNVIEIEGLRGSRADQLGVESESGFGRADGVTTTDLRPSGIGYRDLVAADSVVAGAA
jgi:hypothetical protein